MMADYRLELREGRHTGVIKETGHVTMGNGRLAGWRPHLEAEFLLPEGASVFPLKVFNLIG